MRWLLRLAIAVVVLVFVGNVLYMADSVFFQGNHPPVGNVQRGPRGSGLFYVYNPRKLTQLVAANQIPPYVPQAADDGPEASALFSNLQVLGHVRAGEFIRLMVNMTSWVAPSQGCAACHDTENFASDALYTKRVARRMLQMVRHINADWTRHVAQTGVTCYTCHRGQRVPTYVWFNDPGPAQAGGFAQAPAGKNHPNPVAGGSALPLDPLTPFLEGHDEIRVQSATALPLADRRSIKQTEWTYALMIFFAQALGVNCDYCHNTRAFGDWAQSPPQRVTAWYGIRMVRDLNDTYLDPLQDSFPPERLGTALGDAPKVNCATCHNGVFKPLFGVSMAAGFPELNAALVP
jgi:photosynthetic reaction center cytochrome c subunit